MKLNRVIFFLLITSFAAQAQRGGTDDPKRQLSKVELRHTANRVETIKFSLNRMIRFEKELKQKNYYLNEKTELVEELISIIKSLKQSLDVVEINEADVKAMFGKPSYKTESVIIYEIETYKSNCPFMQISFYMQQKNVSKLDYKITDCQRWK